MSEVRNRSRLAGNALNVVGDAILDLVHVDDLDRYAAPHPRVDILRSVAYDDGTHDLVAATPSVFISFGTSCSGEIFSATLWDQNPTDEDLILDRIEGLNPGAIRTNVAHGCRFGGHTPAAKVG